MSNQARVPRVYTDTNIHEHSTLELPKRSSHHLTKVLRLPPGSGIELFNGDGFNYPAILKSTGKTVQADVTDKVKNTTESPLRTILVQGVSRGDKMDTTIQKSVELGVNSIIPAYTQHSIKPLADDRKKRKLEHWQQIAIAASEQCGRSTIATVHPPIQLLDWLVQQEAPVIEGHPPASQTMLQLTLDPMANSTLEVIGKVEQVRLIIGPETGLTDDEIKSSARAGFIPTTLGPRVLRTETAAPAALAVLQALYGDFC